MTVDETPRKSLLYRLRLRLARAIMPDEIIFEHEVAQSTVENAINEMHFKVGVVAGYKKGIEETEGTPADYRVEDELQ